jgi:hypothetical protein
MKEHKNLKVDRRGFYFTLDALMAFVLLIVVIVILPYSSFQKTSEYYKTSYLQEDALQIFSNIKTVDVNDEDINAVIKNSVYNETLNRDDFLIESVSKLWATNGSIEGRDSAGDAKLIASEFFGNVFESRDNIGLFFSNGSSRDLIFAENESPYQNGERFVIGATNFISGISKGKAVKGNTARAFLRRKESTKIVYFGGYIGDGNITSAVDLSGMINISNVSMEIAINHDFNLFVNNNYIGHYSGSSDLLVPRIIYFSEASFGNFTNGTNTLEFRNSSSLLAIAGGYARIDYKTDAPEYKSATIQYLPQVEGVINEYDSIYAPNTITSMSAKLHYRVNLTTGQNSTIFLKIGNLTVYRNTTNYTVLDFTKVLSNSDMIAAGLNYKDISNKTIPIRVGFEEIAGNASSGEGVADVVLITDVSGSMDWSMGEDDSGSPEDFPISQCGNLSNQNNKIFWANNSRMSLARCLDIEFAATILKLPGNRIGLVAYNSSPIGSYRNLTTNLTLIVNGSSGISGYRAGGGTAVCAGIRKAKQMLRDLGNDTRRKFILVMTDGLANYQCNDNSIESLSVCSPDDCTTSNNNCLPNNGLGCTYRVFPIFNTSERRGEIFNISLPLSGNPDALVVGDINTKRGYNFSNGRWVNSSTYASGFTSRGYVTSIFNLTRDGNLSVITSNFSNTLPLGYTWNGASWSSSSIVTGLPTGRAVGEIVYNFNNDGNFTLFAGNASGYIGGYSWNGTGWVYNASIVNGIGDQGSNTFPAVAFNVTGDGNWTMIIGRTSSTSPVGFYWNGSVWKTKSAYVNGLSGVGDAGYAYTPDFEYNLTTDRWYVLLGVRNTETFFFAWDSGKWYKTCGDAVSDHAADQAITEASRVAALTKFNKTYAVGFGPIEYCPFAQTEMKDIAATGNGEYLVSRNSTQLRDTMKKWADDITSLSFAEQMVNLTGNFSSVLYNDSYIEYNYVGDSIDGDLLEKFGSVVTYESDNFENSRASFSFSSGIPLEAIITSYSGPKWTKYALINNTDKTGNNFMKVFNLSDFGSNYNILGDPFRVNIPIELIAGNQSNIVELKIGNVTSDSNASNYDKILYTLLIISNYSYSKVAPYAQGCNWSVEYYKGQDSFLVPENYSGSNRCYYNSTIDNDEFKCADTNQGNALLENDAIVQATYYLLRDNLDKNPDDCKLDIKVSDYYISTMLLPSVPILYYSKAEFLSWR